MQLNQYYFSVLHNISPAIFNHTYDSYENFVQTCVNKDMSKVLNVLEFQKSTDEYVKKFGRKFQKWYDKLNPCAKKPKCKKRKEVNNIAVLCVIWKRLAIKKPFPVLPPHVLVKHSYIRVLEKVLKRQAARAAAAKINDLDATERSKLKEKTEEKIQDLQNKNIAWETEMTAWKNRYRNHKDFSKKHPEMVKYFKMKKEVKEKMRRLQSKLRTMNGKR